jgi:hypothetical protein
MTLNQFQETFKGEMVQYVRGTDGYWKITGGGITFFAKFSTLALARNYLRRTVK